MSAPLERPAAPPSPSSPPRSEFIKRQQQAQKSLANNPQTPTSPLSMSTPSNRHASPMSSSHSQQHIMAPTNTFPTPASIITDSITTANHDDESQLTRTFSNEGSAHQNLGKRQREDDGSDEENDKRRKTNHDRKDSLPTPSSTAQVSQDVVMADQGSTGKIWLDGGLGQAWMREPVGSPYLLCRIPHPPCQPHPSQDLIALYGLSPLAATVARTLPNGEKNKLRKTYKGKMEAAKLAGRHKETSHPEGQPGSLPELMGWPDEEWHVQKAAGLNIDRGLPEATLAKLGRAFKMDPGPLPDFDASILGLDIDDHPPPAIQATARSYQTQQPASRVQANSASQAAEISRTRRMGIKRSYDERSFEGYGEGYVDDEADLEGYDSGSGLEGRRGSGGGGGKKKRRRNDYSGATSPGLGERTSSYGNSMMGISNGISAYGR